MTNLVQSYPTDLKYSEWELIADLFPPDNTGRGRHNTWPKWQIVNAILYVNRTGCPWRMLPKDFPHWSTVYGYFWRWTRAGLWEQINTRLVKTVRVQQGRADQPSAAVLDSQSVKTSEGGEQRGVDVYKQTNGRKRHVLVDTLGLILMVVVTSASVQDGAGGLGLLQRYFERVKHSVYNRWCRLKLIWADGAYAHTVEEIRRRFGWQVSVIQRPEHVKGFVILPKRWVAKRSGPSVGWGATADWHGTMNTPSPRVKRWSTLPPPGACSSWRPTDLKNTHLEKELASLRGQAPWMAETLIEIIISEGQNEVADFKKWNFDIIPHRALMKQGFEVGEKRVDVESAFKDPQHPFRVAIVCAMWLTGFDVECLSTLYIDKPMKAHTLMQAIARTNRVYPGKDFGLIVDYNGMLKSLREALAQYALGDAEGAGGAEEIIAPIEERVAALLSAIEETERHLRDLDFNPARLTGAHGFAKIRAIADAVEAIHTSEDARHRFEIMARQVFTRFKALVMEPTAFMYAERHDNIEAIYKKLEERRDNTDVTDLLKELHRIVNEAIRAAAPGDDQSEASVFDMSQLDLARLRDEFNRKVTHKATAIEDIRQVVERKLAQMVERNPARMDYYKRYSDIIADYNREKDRVTLEETFARLVDFMSSLDDEQRRAAEEGLSEDELALFDLLKKDNLTKADRERVKSAS